MNDETKDDILLEVDGVEEWMAQFVMDPFFDGNIDGFRMDLFETDSSYIIEAIVPQYSKDNITIKVVKGGLHVIFKKLNKNTTRFITLPFSLCRKKIQATINHDRLEICIPKKGKRKRKPYRTIKIN
ncbi:Hsp20/alpha crystallin family protein [Bacillus pinisoli]|uniref:Hsp20/alpha crystallin family protein n=1 Tax=Bacillus pinisoli TaxID=2901866 RepID=UPI001FF0E0DC|nr:Hsp20/alpha crystallin family protein [Bacillus pinisoli]